jgi:Fe2+ or Zn2+ uptake regulation protein
VLEALVRAPAHFTVDDVLRLAPKVGRATVFRAMKLLLDLNAVCRVMMEDGSLHYRLSMRGHHHHLVCGPAGVEDFSTCDNLARRELARNTATDRRPLARSVPDLRFVPESRAEATATPFFLE